MKRFTLMLLQFLFTCSFVFAQSLWLDKKLSLSYTQISAKVVFASIERQTGVVFVYSNLNDKQPVTIQCNQCALSKVLNELTTQMNCSFKQNEKYIILINTPQNTISKGSSTRIKGFVYESETTQPLNGVSIFNRVSKESCLSDAAGKFELGDKTKEQQILLHVAYDGYKDTLVLFDKNNPKVITLYLSTLKDTIKPQSIGNSTQSAIKDSIKEGNKPDYFARIKRWIAKQNNKNKTYKNVKDTLYSEFALSLVPFVTTNKRLGLQTVNKYALNILGGYSRGTDAVEVGGLINMNRENVKFVQVAGLANMVGGNVFGTQVAGLANLNAGYTNGVQVAGLVNLVAKETRGIQVAGISNFSLQGNRYLQVAGISNYAKESYGTQIAGILNCAHTVNGIQISLVNYADSIVGIPIGFLSIVKKGYHHFELVADEQALVHLGYRTGVLALHNIFFAGYQMGRSNPIWTYGYGIGSIWELGKKSGFNVDFTVQQLMATQNIQPSLSLVNKLSLGYVYSFHKKFEVTGGPVANLSIFDTSGANYLDYFKPYSNNYIFRKKSGTTELTFWVGLRVGIRFL